MKHLQAVHRTQVTLFSVDHTDTSSENAGGKFWNFLIWIDWPRHPVLSRDGVSDVASLLLCIISLRHTVTC